MKSVGACSVFFFSGREELNITPGFPRMQCNFLNTFLHYILWDETFTVLNCKVFLILFLVFNTKVISVYCNCPIIVYLLSLLLFHVVSNQIIDTEELVSCVICSSCLSLSRVVILVLHITHFKGRLKSTTATCKVFTKQVLQSTLCLQGNVCITALALLHTIHYSKEKYISTVYMRVLKG